MKYLWCEEHEGLVPAKDVEETVGEITGNVFYECKIHPNAGILKIFTIENIEKIYGLRSDNWSRFK